MEQKLTLQALCGTVYKELLATAELGRPTRQALRLPVAVVEALEHIVPKQDVTFCHRVRSWWILLHCWATLRFSDHRGLNPDEHFTVEGNSLAARLTRSNTIGTDKRVTFRTVVITSQCFVLHRLGTSENNGKLLQELLVASATNGLRQLRATRARLRCSISRADQNSPDTACLRRTRLSAPSRKVLDAAFTAKLPHQRRRSSERSEGRQTCWAAGRRRKAGDMRECQSTGS